MKQSITSILLAFTLAATSASRAEDFVIKASEFPAVRFFSIQMDAGATATKIEVRAGKGKLPLLSLQIIPDKEGGFLSFHSKENRDGKMVSLGRSKLEFWPRTNDARALAALKRMDVPDASKQSWQGKSLPGVIRVGPERVKVWLAGRLLLNEPLEVGRKGSETLAVHPGKATHFEWKKGKMVGEGYQPVEFAHLLGASEAPEILEKSGIPFQVWNGGKTTLSLKNAGWPQWKSDPSRYVEIFDSSSRLWLMDDGRMPFVQIPNADYLAAYVLAYAEKEEGTTNAFTLRAGRKHGARSGTDYQLFQRDFFGRVPYGSSLQVVRVPFSVAFAQNIEGDVMDIVITKELRLARRAPDPSRFRWRPLGLPSNVRIAAITLEKSPIQMEVRPAAAGALFEQPKRVAYNLMLTNITGEPRDCTVTLTVAESTQEVSVHVPAGGTIKKSVTLEVAAPGRHELKIALSDKKAGPLLAYETAFGVLPADTRKHRDEAPWGTWDFSGVHFTPDDADQIGRVMQKLGLRYGMFGATPEERKQYDVVKGNEFKVNSRTKEPEKTADAYREALKKNPDLLQDFLIFHEDSISGGHATRVPDLFHDRPPYKLNAQEKERFQAMWDIAIASAKSMRKEYPDVKIHLGNGVPTLREEFYRHKFPAELFDAAGNESAAFGRPPETQPPDIASTSASLWMDRQMLDAYGYSDKAVSQCYETTYPSTNPGNLSYQTQADYFVRHILHSMVWGVPKIRVGLIADAGNSYSQSNWGSSGFMTGRSKWTPKPSAIALATLTRMLDGATYKDFLETGSDSAYLLHFVKKNGVQVFPFWTIRGQREYILSVEGASGAKLISQDGKTTDLEAKNGEVTMTAMSSPAYLKLPSGSSIQSVRLGPPSHPDSDPKGKVSLLSPLDSLDGWKVEKKANPLLDYYNPMTPRRKGDFSFEVDGSALKVSPNPLKTGKATMPMYAELVSEKKLELPGKPAEIGLWVNGNSSWGRVIFELEDASGQRWTSIGARSKGGSEWMADWLGKELSDDYEPGEAADWNTDDVFGLSRINFDGWRYVGFPLPGQYPGEGYHWPANSQWRSDKDGIVHYPLTLKKLIIELPEKTLYLTRYEPAKRPWISLRDLVSVERDMNAPKTSPSGYVEKVQVNVN